MKTSAGAISLLAAVAHALPAAPAGAAPGGGNTSNDIQNGQCGTVNLVMARGSTEPGNMGTIVGGGLCAAMQQLGNVACQGVGGNYQATLQANLQPQGTDQQSIQQAMSDIAQAMTTCPTSTLVLAGYSQGTAVMSQAIQSMPAAMQQKVAAVALYGYTKNQQSMGMIPGYPQAQTKVFCNANDGVCGGQLQVTAGHLAYMNDGSVQQGAQFLMQTATAATKRDGGLGALLGGLTGGAGSASAAGGAGSQGAAGGLAGLLGGLTGGAAGGQQGGAGGIGALLGGLTGGAGAASGASTAASGTTGASATTGNGTTAGTSSASGNGTTTTGTGASGNGTATAAGCPATGASGNGTTTTAASNGTTTTGASGNGTASAGGNGTACAGSPTRSSAAGGSANLSRKMMANKVKFMTFDV